MQPRALADIIAFLIPGLDPGEYTIHPVTGGYSQSEMIIDTLRSTTIKGGTKEVYAPMIEGWINGHMIPATTLSDDGQGFRSHTDGLGYGINIHSGTRILLEVNRVGYGLTAVYVRPQ